MATALLPPLWIETHRFSARDMIGGDVSIDFVNTAAGLNRDPRDWLDGYPRLIEWAALSNAFEPANLDRLRRLGDARPNQADTALNEVRSLRAVLYPLLHAARSGAAPTAEPAAALAAWAARAAAATDFVPSDAGLTKVIDIDRAGLDLIALTVAQAAAMLLTERPLPLIGRCDGSNCGWLFLDTSKNKRRRWCDMTTCGNAAKARRHYRKHAAAPVS